MYKLGDGIVGEDLMQCWRYAQKMEKQIVAFGCSF
jgi:hypothetical protein